MTPRPAATWRDRHESEEELFTLPPFLERLPSSKIKGNRSAFRVYARLACSPFDPAHTVNFR